MRRIATLSAFLVCAVAAAARAQVPTAVQRAAEARENAIWQAVKDKQPDRFGAMLAPSYTAVYAYGVQDKTQEVDGMRGVNLRSFALSSFQGRAPDARTLIVTYRADVQGDAGGHDFTGGYWCSSVWRLVNGQWRGALHTEARAG